MVGKRLAISLVLTAIALVAFFGFLVLAAYEPAALIAPAIGAVPLSFVLAACLIVGAVLLTAIYVWQANAAEDRL